MTLLIAVILFAAAGLATADDLQSRYRTPDQETRQAVIALLRENRLKYGDDAAMMQGLLLVHANLSGAILATEVAIVGFEEREQRRFVSFRVDIGTIFDDNTMDEEQRLEQVWRSILERTLLRYPTFSVPGDGIAVEIQYNHRPYTDLSELYRTFDDHGVVEHAKFYLLTSDLLEFLAHRLESRELLDRSAIFVDDRPVKVKIHDFVGPPEPDPRAGDPTPDRTRAGH
jgi:hypothetical protein